MFFTSIRVCDILVSSGICSGRRYVGVIMYSGSGVLSDKLAADDDDDDNVSWLRWLDVEFRLDSSRPANAGRVIFELFSGSSNTFLLRWFTNCCTNVDATSGLSPLVS